MKIEDEIASLRIWKTSLKVLALKSRDLRGLAAEMLEAFTMSIAIKPLARSSVFDEYIRQGRMRQSPKSATLQSHHLLYVTKSVSEIHFNAIDHGITLYEDLGSPMLGPICPSLGCQRSVWDLVAVESIAYFL